MPGRNELQTLLFRSVRGLIRKARFGDQTLCVVSMTSWKAAQEQPDEAGSGVRRPGWLRESPKKHRLVLCRISATYVQFRFSQWTNYGIFKNV